MTKNIGINEYVVTPQCHWGDLVNIKCLVGIKKLCFFYVSFSIAAL